MLGGRIETEGLKLSAHLQPWEAKLSEIERLKLSAQRQYVGLTPIQHVDWKLQWLDGIQTMTGWGFDQGWTLVSRPCD